MDDASPTPSWSEIASWYDELVSGGSGPHDTAVSCTLALVGDVRGLRLLDTACGQGLASRALADAGAEEVVGVDSSEQMLELARGRGAPANLRYVLDDAQRLRTFPDESFDGVNCQLGLMDIPDLAAALTAAYRVLRPGGWFTSVIGHPCFLAPNAATAANREGRTGRWIGEYFDERFWRSPNPHGVRRAGNHHRPLSTYINQLLTAGFVIDRVDEPRPSARLKTEQPVYDLVPIFWAMRTHRPATTVE